MHGYAIKICIFKFCDKVGELKKKKKNGEKEMLLLLNNPFPLKNNNKGLNIKPTTIYFEQDLYMFLRAFN